ncbi:MAG: peptidase [Oscillatoriales cyanobacterium]|uniref:DVUA0089 family protein n=1 Tax=Microcoleus anatoxicus PTRS2 TaxID=2705321 RepID=A0ABU8YSR1_9CYAN|nr:MAG: peptidase [Oscillatoriales cyanobacterium]TAD95138.1 MAG: peptidase [Oscillatoriales cyanobacterium]TAD98628.1 MAG: peptidase [Oscillatoriales cyanobacterium]TAF06151.1 MAG: peptidase [Oscillatoriales cyanobacterium]TAF31638.1 MAG: peptidase [Oscillatoriales cyanobacterium]
MRQVRFWAIAPIALLATVSAKPVASSPIFDASGVLAPGNSTLIAAGFSQNAPHTDRDINHVLAQATPKSSPSAIPTPSALPIPAAGSSKVILEKQGELTPANSSVLPSDSSLYDEYTFEGTTGQTVVVSLESGEFDTYLAVFNSKGELLAENDDATEQNSNSELTVTLSASGSYKVIVNAFDSPPKGKGKYSLKVREVIKN